MSEILAENISEPSQLPFGETRQVAIVGINREAATLLSHLIEADGVQVIKVLNPDLEDLSRLTQYPHLTYIIDTTHNSVTAARLRKLPLKKVDVISSIGARILFCGFKHSQNGEKENILRNMEEIREAVCLTKNKEEILKVILNTAIRTGGADCGSLMLLDPTKRKLTIEAAYGLEDHIVISSSQKVGHGISGMAVRNREAILIHGAADQKVYATDYQKPEVVSAICCPILYADEAIGVINISSKNINRLFTSMDVDFLKELACLTAEVIKTTRDYDSNQHSTYTLGLLNNAREILAMKYRMEERINLLLMKVANAFGAKECTYFEFNPLDKNFLAKASSTITINLPNENPVWLDEIFAQRVLKTSNTICFNTSGKSPRSKEWILLQPIRINNGTELVGTLFVNLPSDKNQVKDEAALLKKIGDMLVRELSKNREMEYLKVQSLKYSAISQFSFDIANAKSLPDLTKMILSNVRLILESETCLLRLRNSPSEPLIVFEFVSYCKDDQFALIKTIDENISGKILPGQGIKKIESIRRSEFAMDELIADSMLIVAIELHGEVIGTLSLYDKKSLDMSSGKRFTENDKDILLNFGLQVSKGLKRFFPFAAFGRLE